MDPDMDLGSEESLKKFEEMLDNVAEPGKLPSRKQLMDMLESSELSEDLKESMRQMMSGGAPQLFGKSSGGSYLGLIFGLIIFLILLFFGYKLYKSIKDKEVKREEKKKQKQMKKKK